MANKNLTGEDAASQRAADDQHLPGEEGVWVFVIGDLVVFTLFFAIFLAYRSEDLALFRASRLQLDLHLGMLNTLLLLASSWLLVSSVSAFRQRQLQRCKHSMGLTVLCGAGFAMLKYVEYTDKLGAGITPQSNEFFTFYYLFTGIHLIHLLVGLVVLAYLWFELQRAGLEATTQVTMESSATYWHMVDLLWVLLFSLLYLLP